MKEKRLTATIEMLGNGEGHVSNEDVEMLLKRTVDDLLIVKHGPLRRYKDELRDAVRICMDAGAPSPGTIVQVVDVLTWYFANTPSDIGLSIREFSILGEMYTQSLLCLVKRIKDQEVTINTLKEALAVLANKEDHDGHDHIQGRG